MHVFGQQITHAEKGRRLVQNQVVPVEKATAYWLQDWLLSVTEANPPYLVFPVNTAKKKSFSDDIDGAHMLLS